MSKKLGDMTLNEIVKICTNHPGCDDCPFGADGVDYEACMTWWRLADSGILSVEIPI